MRTTNPMPCRFPGCVAESAGGDTCAVHRAPTGCKLCETCHGSGLYFYSGQSLTMACQDCGGVGFRDARISTRVPTKERVAVDKRGLIEESEKK